MLNAEGSGNECRQPGNFRRGLTSLTFNLRQGGRTLFPFQLLSPAPSSAARAALCDRARSAQQPQQRWPLQLYMMADATIGHVRGMQGGFVASPSLPR